MSAPPPVYALTNQLAILAALSEHLALRGYPPTLRELGTATGVPFRTVHNQLERLRARGYVTWEDGQPRTLRFCT